MFNRLSFALTIFMLSFIIAAHAEEKPIIGVTMSYDEREEYHDRVMLTMPTIDAVTLAGGIPVLLPPLKSEADVDRFFDIVDGFVFTGGPDINPDTYEREKHETTSIMAARREDFDLLLMKKVLESDKPILGICLGMQEMNVACEGTLIQDIPSETDSTLIHKGEGSGHDVNIVDGTKLFDLLGGETFSVNSIHHQSVDDLGEGLTITATSPDGIIEGIKKPDHPFAIGVQWHPEHLTKEEPHLNIFRGLIEAAKRSAKAGTADVEKTVMIQIAE